MKRLFIFAIILITVSISIASRIVVSPEKLKMDLSYLVYLVDKCYPFPWRHISREEFMEKVEEIKPYMIFWEYGYDATSGDYGSRGISMKAHVEMAQEVKRIADEFCDGRLVVILCGGSRRDIANYTIPRIIKTLLGG